MSASACDSVASAQLAPRRTVKTKKCSDHIRRIRFQRLRRRLETFASNKPSRVVRNPRCVAQQAVKGRRGQIAMGSVTDVQSTAGVVGIGARLTVSLLWDLVVNVRGSQERADRVEEPGLPDAVLAGKARSLPTDTGTVTTRTGGGADTVIAPNLHREIMARKVSAGGSACPGSNFRVDAQQGRHDRPRWWTGPTGSTPPRSSPRHKRPVGATSSTTPTSPGTAHACGAARVRRSRRVGAPRADRLTSPRPSTRTTEARRHADRRPLIASGTRRRRITCTPPAGRTTAWDVANAPLPI